MPKVSVIIPTYNRSYIVCEAIDSILSQTVTDIELLVVDDGSTDDTRQVVEAINDERIRYLYKQNGGVSSARNVGISHAKGSYVAFLDSDDVWPERFLEAVSNALDADTGYGLAYTATIQKYPDGQTKTDDLARCLSGQITSHLFEHSTIWPMAVLIRKTVLEGFWFDENLKICDDNDAFLRLSANNKFLFVPDIYVSRRFSSDSHSTAAFTEGAYIRALSLERFYFQLGGDKIVASSVAKKKIGRVYRRAGERYRKEGYRKAAIGFLKRAIRYCPFDGRLYIGLVKAIMLKKTKDSKADWHMPKKLGKPLHSVKSITEDE